MAESGFHLGLQQLDFGGEAIAHEVGLQAPPRTHTGGQQQPCHTMRQR